MLTAIIVEDELKSRDALRNLLIKFCPEVRVIGEALTVREAVKLIQAAPPNIVFLDVELPQENGFKLLHYFPKAPFDIIFTTAYDQYAVQAFRLAAVDYLLKPIAVDQLREAIRKSREKTEQQHRQLELLTENNQSNFRKIALPTTDGYCFIEIDHIIFCEASRSYTYFYLTNQQKILVSKPLKAFEETLSPFSFFRINRSYIINLKYIERYSRTHHGEITMSNGKILSVSEQKRSIFLRSVVRR